MCGSSCCAIVLYTEESRKGSAAPITHCTERSGVAPHKSMKTRTTDSEPKRALKQNVENRNGGERRSRAINAVVPLENRAVAAGQICVLRSSVGSDGKRAAKEDRASTPHRSIVAWTRRKTNLRGARTLWYWSRVVKWDIRVFRCANSNGLDRHNWDAHGVQPWSEVRVSCRRSIRDILQEDEIVSIVLTTTGLTESTKRDSKIEHIPDSAVRHVRHFILRKLDITTCLEFHEGMSPEKSGKNSCSDSGLGEGWLKNPSTQIVVKRSKRLALKVKEDLQTCNWSDWTAMFRL